MVRIVRAMREVMRTLFGMEDGDPVLVLCPRCELRRCRCNEMGTYRGAYEFTGNETLAEIIAARKVSEA